MNAATQILFETLEPQNFVGTALFLFAASHKDLRRFEAITLVQPHKMHAAPLMAKGYEVQAELAAAEALYDTALVLLPKDMTEARYALGQALTTLKPGGVLIAAAENKAGGRRLPKLLLEFGLSFSQSVSRYKSRAVTAEITEYDESAVQAALAGGAPLPVLEGAYISQPGIFGWDKIDKGSALLADNLPSDLTGRGADFGCGYGYLSREVLSKNPDISELVAIDADARAVACCAQNLTDFGTGAKIKTLWADLCCNGDTISYCVPPELENLDFIVMNPPFHSARATDITLGTAMIKTAARALKPGGTLWMVANRHLPYEQVLQTLFTKAEKAREENGFKVFCANN